MYQSNYKRYKKFRRRRVLKTILAVILLFTIGFFAAFLITGDNLEFTSSGISINKKPTEINPDNIIIEGQTDQEKPDPEPEPEMVKNSLYIDISRVTDPSYASEIINKHQNKEINSVVIPLKNDDGTLNYKSSLAYTSVSEQKTDVLPLLQTLKESGVYVLAEVSVFKDNNYARKYPNSAIKTKNGVNWLDFYSQGWIDPYSEEGMTYIKELISEISSFDIDEILLKDFTFPSRGKNSLINYRDSQISREDILVQRALELKEIKTPMSIKLSGYIYDNDSITFEKQEKFLEVFNICYFPVQNDDQNNFYSKITSLNKGIYTNNAQYTVNYQNYILG